VVERYIRLGLRLGRLVDGLVDAYYGPGDLDREVRAEGRPEPGRLVDEAARLLGDLDAGVDAAEVDAGRRRWLRAQVVGLHTTARKLDGEVIAYADEVELSYGVRPSPVPEDDLASAHSRLDELVPGSGPLAERYVSWREAHTIGADKLEQVVRSLADEFRERVRGLFGLPEGEHVDWQFVRDQPWSGFNYYLGGLRSRVAINVDLPVLSTSIAHLVAHEAYPGHHTEHTRKEVGLVRTRQWLEESIFLVGTPQCLLAEGLADLGLEVVAGSRPEALIAEHLRPLGVRYDAEVIATVAEASETLAAVRANAAWMLHQEHRPADEVVAYVERWGLLSRVRAQKAVEFLTDPTWRAYISCYVEGLPLCRSYVDGDPARFERLLTEQLVPADLAA
jgi:hypothetical protein